MKTSEAIEIIQDAVIEVDDGSRIHKRLLLLLNALEVQQGFEVADTNTRGLLREVIQVCEAVFVLMSVKAMSDATIKSAVADAHSIIKQARSSGLIA